MHRFRRPSPAMVLAFVALVAALSGTAVALPGTNSVDSGDIRNNTVRSKDLRNNQVGTKDVKNNNLRSNDVRNNTLTGNDIRNDSLTGTDINESSLGKVPSAGTADSAGTANSATNATTAANGVSGRAQFNPDGTVLAGAVNMNNLTAASPTVLCEDQDFAAVVATGGLLGGTGGTRPVDAVSDEQLAAEGADPTGVGCPAGTHWVYVIDNHPGGGAGPSYFTVVAFG